MALPEGYPGVCAEVLANRFILCDNVLGEAGIYADRCVIEGRVPVFGDTM